MTGGRGTRRWAPAPVVVLAAVLLAAVAAGCGISEESSAHRIDAEDVPFGLLEEEPPAPSAPATGRTVEVYLVADERLVSVERSAPESDGPGALLAILEAGPNEEEVELGISTSLPPDQVAGVALARGVAQVDLVETFTDLRSADQIVAIAQIVYTLTGRPGIGRVGFTLEGEPVEVPRGDGALTTDSLARDDFVTLAPLR